MKVECWLVLKGTPSYGATFGSDSPYAGQKKDGVVRASKMTAKKPSLSDDEIAVKVVLDVPWEWFLSPTGVVNVTIPTPKVEDLEIPVVVDMPVRGRQKSDAAKELGM